MPASLDIRPDRALAEEGDAVEPARLLGEDLDELFPDDLALLLGVGNARELVEEAVDRVHVDEVRVHLAAEHADDLFRLALAQQTVVDVHAGEVFADRADQQRGDDGRVHAAREGQQDLFVADLFAQHADALVDVGFRELGRGDARHVRGTGFECHIHILRCVFLE